MANYSDDIGGISTSTISNYYEHAVTFIEQAGTQMQQVYTDGYELDGELSKVTSTVKDEIQLANMTLASYVDLVFQAPDSFNLEFKDFMKKLNESTEEVRIAKIMYLLAMQYTLGITFTHLIALLFARSHIKKYTIPRHRAFFYMASSK